jgi:cellulose synthase/poly-beta-1,6-N-acetylglucosamine synthase-like glycosyltransferase
MQWAEATEQVPMRDAQPEAAIEWPHVGVVVIGRNEGRRLARSLRAVVRGVRKVVYVDSGSTDDSLQIAAAFGAEIVELDPRFPFNAGRARAEGFGRLRALFPRIRYVQFVDGDSEIMPGWIDTAAAFLDSHPDVAAVTGRLRERHPERSIYNTFCAMEWDAYPEGEVSFCGGNAMMRVAALAQVGTFRSDLVSGEEPELCHRLHAANWRVWLLPEAIAVHDAAITRFGQWWKRTVRSGYGCIQATVLYGGVPNHAGFRPIARAWFWVLAVPLAALALVPWLGAWASLVLLAYPVQIIRQRIRGAGRRPGAWAWAVFSLVMMYPFALGQLQCLVHQCLQRKSGLIEYKSPGG